MHKTTLIVLLFLAPSWSAQTGAPVSAAVIETEVVYIGPGGFFPSLIQRPAGKFRLLLLNHSGLENLTPQFVDQGGKALVQFDATGTQSRRLINDIDVPAGSFHLKESSQPSWDLTIEIKP